MRLEWADSISGMEQLAPEWRELHDALPRSTPFEAPEWLIPWTQYVFEGGEIRIAAAHDGSSLEGIAPFFLYGTSRRTLAFLGAGISDYGDVMCRDEGPARDVLTWIDGCGADPDLREIREGSALLQDAGEPCSVCPTISLPAEPQHLDKLLDSKLRTDLHRARNRLERLRFRFTIADEATLDCYLDALFRLHAARWALENEPGVLCNERIQSFHRAVARAFLHRGWLRLHALHVDGEIAGVLYGFLAHRRFYSYLGGFDPRFSKLSCGALLIREAIENSIREGCDEFDFLRNPEPYKYLWGATDRPTFRLGSR